MTDPLVPFRHSEKSDPVARLLAAAAPSMKTPALSAASRAKILGSLPASGAAPAATGLSWLKLAGVVGVGLGVLGALTWSSLGSAPRDASVAPVASIASAAPVASVAVPAPLVAAPVFSVRDLPTAAPVVASSDRRAAPAIGANEAPDTLSREVAILDRARASADPATRLAILAEHARAFPSGKLAPEREVFAVEALLQAGRREEARTRGDAFVRTQPGGAHAARVRALLR